MSEYDRAKRFMMGVAFVGIADLIFGMGMAHKITSEIEANLERCK